MADVTIDLFGIFNCAVHAHVEAPFKKYYKTKTNAKIQKNLDIMASSYYVGKQCLFGSQKSSDFASDPTDNFSPSHDLKFNFDKLFLRKNILI